MRETSENNKGVQCKIGNLIRYSRYVGIVVYNAFCRFCFSLRAFSIKSFAAQVPLLLPCNSTVFKHIFRSLGMHLSVRKMLAKGE